MSPALYPTKKKILLYNEYYKKLISCLLSHGESWLYKKWQFQGKKCRLYLYENQPITGSINLVWHMFTFIFPNVLTITKLLISQSWWRHIGGELLASQWLRICSFTYSTSNLIAATQHIILLPLAIYSGQRRRNINYLNMNNQLVCCFLSNQSTFRCS